MFEYEFDRKLIQGLTKSFPNPPVLESAKIHSVVFFVLGILLVIQLGLSGTKALLSNSDRSRGQPRLQVGAHPKLFVSV